MRYPDFTDTALSIGFVRHARRHAGSAAGNMTITDKWTIDPAGNWIKIPFIRDSRGDRPAIPPSALKKDERS